ncbi:MAG: cytochrome c3 family protein [Pseudomonadota bacterium]
MKVAKICAVTVAVLLFAYTPLVLAQQEAKGLASVFGRDRSGTEDVIHLRNGEKESGTILNKTLGFNTPYGLVETPLKMCAGISYEAWGAGVDVLNTVNFNRISGLAVDRDIRIKRADGAEKTLRKEEIKSIILKKSQAEEALSGVQAGSGLFVMTNGDVLTGQVSDGHLKLDLGTMIESVYPGQFAEKVDAADAEAVKTKFLGATLNPQTSPASMDEAKSEAPDEVLLANKGFKMDYVGPVQFTHRKHFEDYNVTCAACHHWQADPIWACSSCHDPNAKAGKVVDLKNAYHTDCKGCHEAAFKAGKTQKAPFAKCADCHQAKK